MHSALSVFACCAALRCAALRCAVLCCAVLCCAVLCCAVLCCAVLCCAVLCCAVLCCAAAEAGLPQASHCSQLILQHKLSWVTGVQTNYYSAFCGMSVCTCMPQNTWFSRPQHVMATRSLHMFYDGCTTWRNILYVTCWHFTCIVQPTKSICQSQWS